MIKICLLTSWCFSLSMILRYVGRSVSHLSDVFSNTTTCFQSMKLEKSSSLVWERLVCACSSCSSCSCSWLIWMDPSELFCCYSLSNSYWCTLHSEMQIVALTMIVNCNYFYYHILLVTLSQKLIFLINKMFSSNCFSIAVFVHHSVSINCSMWKSTV